MARVHLEHHVRRGEALRDIALAQETSGPPTGSGEGRCARRSADAGPARRAASLRVDPARMATVPTRRPPTAAPARRSSRFRRPPPPHLVARPRRVVAQHAPIAELAPHHLVVADGVDGVGPARVGGLEARDLRVLVGQDDFDARQRGGLADVETSDPGPRIGQRSTRAWSRPGYWRSEISSSA